MFKGYGAQAHPERSLSSYIAPESEESLYRRFGVFAILIEYVIEVLIRFEYYYGRV